ncbi:MAG TPA: secondary thiamine-phosphate synthase enzyme YjbQ [Gemmatimonadales bacterium]|nr:secondary thiamine-phosphate synthase enzyme YjbQ [Gemmatimonadales bacterium]
MNPINHNWTIRLAAEFGHADITPELQSLVTQSGIRSGVLTIQMLGSTGAITTIEYESGALNDLRRALDILAPADADYDHNARWGDGNGFSHVRSALLKTSLSLPIVEGELALGTWQQVVAINLDNRARERELIAIVLG